MALPKLLQKLFQNGGAGDKLRPDIVPTTLNGNKSDANGNFTAEQTGCLPTDGSIAMTGSIAFEGNNKGLRNTSTDNVLVIAGGTDTSNGGSFYAIGGTNADRPGYFCCTARKAGSNGVQLVGTPEGGLTWGGKEVERVSSSGTNYIRYESGVQICWGRTTVAAGQTIVTVTIPAAFVNNNYAPVATVQNDSGGFMTTTNIVNTSTIKISPLSKDNSTTYSRTVNWFCVGKWK